MPLLVRQIIIELMNLLHHHQIMIIQQQMGLQDIELLRHQPVIIPQKK